MKNKVKKIVFDLKKKGYAIKKNIISKQKVKKYIKSLEKMNNYSKKNKFFLDELSHNGQVIIRDLVLRDPKVFLNIIDVPIVMEVLKDVFKDKFILDNIMASNSINTKKQYSKIHIDAHLPTKEFKNTTDMVVFFCLNDFTKENGCTKIWPKSHLSGIRIHHDKNYKKNSNKKFDYAEAPAGSCVFLLGQTWHQIGKNTNFKDRWGIIIHFKKWWIKPSTDYTNCGIKIFKTLTNIQKELFGFNSISPTFNFQKQTRILKTLRNINSVSKNYKKAKSF